MAAEAPDLILVSAAGNDSALRLVDQLKAIAPVLVVGYDNRSWQQVVELLGQATGREDAADGVVDRCRVARRDDGDDAVGGSPHSDSIPRPPGRSAAVNDLPVWSVRLVLPDRAVGSHR